MNKAALSDIASHIGIYNLRGNSRYNVGTLPPVNWEGTLHVINIIPPAHKQENKPFLQSRLHITSDKGASLKLDSTIGGIDENGHLEIDSIELADFVSSARITGKIVAGQIGIDINITNTKEPYLNRTVELTGSRAERLASP